MYSKVKLLFLILFLFLLFPTKIRALTITISNLPSEISYSQEVETDLFFNCAGCGDFSYMRGVFFPSGTNYFGFTQNNLGSWVGTSTDRTQYFAIAKTDLIDSNWTGKLKVKPDWEDTAFVGTGEYLFKVGRYTSENDSSADWSNELAVKIIGPTPTPSPVPTSQPTNAATTAPTVVPTVKPTPTKSPSPKPSSTPSPTPSDEPEETDEPTEILGMSIDDDKTATPESIIAGDSTEKKSPILAIIFVILGTGCLGYVGYLLYNGRHAKIANIS